jgi:hypothetical protein
VTHPLGWALLWIEGGGPLGQFLELAMQLLERPDAPIDVGGVTLEQVGDMALGGWPLSRTVSA